MVNAPDNLPAIRDDLSRALSIMTAREPDYRKAREYDDGTREEIGLSDAAKRIVTKSKVEPINFAHVPIDVVAEKVVLSGIGSPDGAAAASLDEWAEANDLEDESADWIRQACRFGDYYVVTDPGDEETVSADEIATVGLSPFAAVVVYDKRTGRDAFFGVHVWNSGTAEKPESKALAYYDDATVSLVAPGKARDSVKAVDFVLDVDAGEDEADAYDAHDGGRMLIAHLAIGGKPYGVPIHRRAWAFQDAIAKISANNLVNVDAQGLPSRWALIDPNAEVDDDIDDDFGTDGSVTASADTDGMTTPTGSSRIRTIPGAINLLRGVKQTGQYDASQSDPFLQNLDWYVRGMAVACGVPLFEFDLNGEQPSGESRRRVEGRVNRKARAVSRQAGAFFREIGVTVLALLGSSADVDASFAPIETATDADGIELVAKKIAVGVPVRKALAEAGYTEEQLVEWFGAGKAPVFPPTLLAALADVLQKLGQAQTLGAISPAEVAAMLPEILTEARNEGVAPPKPVDDAPAPVPAALDALTE